MKPKSSLRNFLALAGSSLLAVSSASAQSTSATWDENNAGNWTTVTNWVGNTAYAEGTDNTATLGNFISADRVITLDTGITIGGISALDTTHNYSISGANTLTLDVTTGQSILNVSTSGRTLTIGTAMTVNDGIEKTGAGALSITGAVSLGGAQTWTNNSAGLFTKTNASLITNNGHQLTFDGTGNFAIGTPAQSTAVLTGSGAIVKNGTGRLDLGGNNTGFSGTVSINGGVLQMHNNAAALGSGNLTLNGGVLSVYWGINYNRTLGDTGTDKVQILGGESGFAGAGATGPTFNLGTSVIWGELGEGSATGFFNPSKFVLGDAGTSNAATTTFSSAIDLNATTRTVLVPFGLSTTTGNVSTISGAISTSSGTAGLTKEGAGTLNLSVANSYNGTTTISGGALRLGTATALPGGIGTTGGTSNLTMNGGYLEIASNNTFARGLGTGGTQVQITGGTSGFSAQGGGRTVNIGGASASITWGSADFAPDVLVLNGITANNTLNFQNPLALGSSNRTVFTAANTATLSGALTGTAGLTKTGAGTLNLTGDVSGLSGTVVMTAGTLARSTGGNLVLPAIEVQSGTLSATLGGTGTLTKTTAGTVTLGNNSAFSGDVFINDGIIGSIGSGTYTGFGTGTVTINGGRLTVNSGATPKFTNAMNWNANFTVDRGPSTMPTITWDGDTTLGANVTMGGSAAGGNYTHIFDGAILDDITGNRSLSFTTVGTGGRAFVTLNGNNTFTGNLSITQGSLTIGGAGKLGGGDYSGNITVSGTTTAPFTYSSSSDQILRGAISVGSSMGLTKDTSSASTLTLRGTNTYTGATTVSAGTLEVAGTGSINSSSGVSITGGEFRYNSTTGLTKGVTVNGGTFRYNSSTDYSGTLNYVTGTLAGTNLTGTAFDNQVIDTGKSISPGNSPGTMEVDNQTWGTGGSYIWEISDATGTAGAAPGWDLLAGTDTLTISATSIDPFTILVTSLALDNLAGNAVNFDNGLNYAWIIADFANPVSGFVADKFVVNSSAFSNVLNGAFGVALGTGVTGGDNTEIYLTYTAVPEPGAALLGSLGLFLILRRRR